MLKPAKDRVVVKLEPFKNSELIIHAGTYSFEAPNFGIIRFLGEDAKKEGLKEGDNVYVEQYTGAQNIDFNGEELKMLKLSNVLGLLEL